MRQTLERTRIAPNLTVVSERVPGVRSVSLGLWINRSSRDEAPSDTGLSHLYEHMVFKGTSRRDAQAIARVLEKSGGSLNAFTSKEQVCFHARFVDDELPAACEVIRDLFTDPVFDPGELAKEKNVVLEEIRGAEDDPEDFVNDALLECLWPESPLGLPIAGRAGTVRAFGRDDLVRIRESFRASPLVIAASGNLRHRHLLQLVRDLKGPVSRPPRRSRAAAPSAQRLFNRPIQQANCCVGFRSCSYLQADRYAMAVGNAILGDGMSSRLFQNIREKLGLAYSVSSFMEGYADTGLFGVFLATDPDRVGQALSAVFDEIRAVFGGGVTAAELDFAKSYIRGGVLLGMENTGNRMVHLARSELYYGRPEPIEHTLKAIDRVGLADLECVGRRYFSDRNTALAIVAPPRKELKRELYKKRF